MQVQRTEINSGYEPPARRERRRARRRPGREIVRAAHVGAVASLALLTLTASQAGAAGTNTQARAAATSLAGSRQAALEVCKLAGHGVQDGARFRFSANARSFTLAARKHAPGGCTTLRFAAGASVRVAEHVPSGSGVAISAGPAKALIKSDLHAGTALLRLRPGKTSIRFTNVVCDQAADMKGDEEVIPADATDVGPEVDVDESRGLVSSLYPGVDTSTDDFYPLPCDPSIGEELPPEVNDPPSQAEVDAETELTQLEQTDGPGIVKDAKQSPPALPAVALPTVGACHFRKQRVRCDSDRFLTKGAPFEGRDIIYVPGFMANDLIDWIHNDPRAHALWPQDPGEYLNANGYFRRNAEAYWRDHIRENLFDPANAANASVGWEAPGTASPTYRRKTNRYLAIAWSSNQTIEYAQHALLTQIQLAMTTNKNVVTPAGYPQAKLHPFCSNGCVIVSHSAGALVTTTALGRARMGAFGPGGRQVAKHIRAHVSFEGALSGSRLASIAMVTGIAAGHVQPLLCATLDAYFGTATCGLDLSVFAHSILRDLMPVVAQNVWGPSIDQSPVPTLTVAGGHPLGNYFGLTKQSLPGVDDGVVSMNSACGNPNEVTPLVRAPSGARVSALGLAFERSNGLVRKARAVKNFLSQKNFLLGWHPDGLKYLAAACTPERSSTGMVMPVTDTYDGTQFDARRRYHNVFSMLQGSIDHLYDGPGDASNPWPSAMTGTTATTPRAYQGLPDLNTEETSAVTDDRVYKKYADGTYLLNPSFGALEEVVRGRRRMMRRHKKDEPRWRWKRTYHLLPGWATKQSSHYVYEFVGRS